MKNMREFNLFGSLDGRSEMLQWLVVLDKWKKIIDDCGVIDSIYSDFKIAFDKVSIKHLLKKTESYSIRGEVVN